MPATASDYSFLREFILARSENILDPSRDDLFEARLYRVMQSRGMTGLDELVGRLRVSADLALDQAVVEAMTINETSFFRDPSFFELVKEKLLPQLIERRGSRRVLRFWSAASSSGQEAYSLAMLISSDFPQIADWEIKIIGTDINAEMVRRAQAGRYQRMEVNRGLPARLLLRYFTRHGEGWEIAPEIRAMCRFHQRNLGQALTALDRYDGILMRNVLFYFSEETQIRILQNARVALQPDGFLLLGASEQPVRPNLWQPVLNGNVCYYTPR